MKKFVFYKKNPMGNWKLCTSTELPTEKLPGGDKIKITQVVELPECDHYRTLGELEILYPLGNSNVV